MIRTEQSKSEDDTQFAEQVSKAARICRHVLSKETLVNYYVQGPWTAVREVVASQVRWMTLHEKEQFSAVRNLAATIGNSRSAFMKENEKTEMTGTELEEGKEKPKRPGKKTLSLFPPAPAMDENVKWELKDQLETADVSSIIEIAMYPGLIMYVGAPQDAMNGGGTIMGAEQPTGDERVLQDFEGEDYERPVIQGRRRLQS